jgi:hypothetical protein
MLQFQKGGRWEWGTRAEVLHSRDEEIQLKRDRSPAVQLSLDPCKRVEAFRSEQVTIFDQLRGASFGAVRGNRIPNQSHVDLTTFSHSTHAVH